MKTMRLTLWVFLAALTCLGPTTGCKTLPESPQAIVFHSLRDTQIAVDKAMRFYGEQCARGRVSVADQARIDRAHAQYRGAFRLAATLAREDYTTWTPENVQQLADVILAEAAKL